MERSLIAAETLPTELKIQNLPDLLNKLRSIRNDGLSNLSLVSDFDLTFTRYKTGGVLGCSTYQLLQSSVLRGERAQYVKDLYTHYHAIEIDPSVGHEEKSRLMNEWWDRSNKALLESSFELSSLRDFVYNSSLYFRYGIKEFFENINENRLQLFIVSGGIGNLVEICIEQLMKVETMKIFSNNIVFDREGKSSHFAHPEVRNDKSKILVGERLNKNLIVMGDLPSDVRMVENVLFENVIKIGFLNDLKIYELENYEKVFDIIVMNDGDFTIVNYLLSFIEGKEFNSSLFQEFQWLDSKLREVV